MIHNLKPKFFHYNSTIVVILLMLISIKSTIANEQMPRIEQNPLSVVVVNISDPVTLECRVSGNPEPKVSWFKKGKLINIAKNNKYTLIRNSDLFIISAKVGRGSRSDSGSYHCKAVNKLGEAKSTNASLLVTYLKEDFRAIPKSRQINSGSVVSMECIAPRGSPEPIIWWEKNGMILQLGKHEHEQESNQLYKSLKNGTFLIRNATLIDNGEYHCVAQNDAGIRRSAPAYLNVFEKPSFLIKPQTGKYEAGTLVRFECQANGFPEPLIEWKKDNLIDNIPIKAQIRDNTLIIPSIELEDQGEYTCLASNQLGNVDAKAYLIVYEKPVFTKVMKNLTIGIESKPLTIECNARGKPQPVIYWAKSGQLPSSNPTAGQDDFIILENGNLFIESLSKKYEGTYLCQASNEYGSIETKTNLMVKSVQSKPPPIVVYAPQNQTIPINTQATLECLTTTTSNVLFDNLSKNSKQELQNQFLSNEKIRISWFKDNQQINTQYDSIKYKIRDTGSLEINSVQTLDTGIYYCMATNLYGQTKSIPASLNVENPNNQYAEFQRNYETTALPSAPTQPVILLATSTSVSLSWQPSSHSGHSPLVSYTIDYFSPEWPQSLPGWIVIAENIPAISSFTIDNLQPDTYYMFMVRARNNQGYGPPSQVSDLTKTLFEPQSLFPDNKNSNEILERALTGEVVQLNEPAHILSSTSISITWEIIKSASLIEGFYIKYKPIGSKHTYTTITVNDRHKTSTVLTNLKKFTPYEILIEPFSGEITGSESNVLQGKTLEDLPSESPENLDVNLDSVASMSIKWQPPSVDHMNGVILGYKISCVANETKYSLSLNTNSTTRAIIVGNLIKGMRYCVQVAAFTKKGTGPFTSHDCVEMSNSFLSNLNIVKNPLIEKNLRDALSEPWLIVCVVLVSVVTMAILFYCVFFLFKRVTRLNIKKKHQKFMSTSSENGSTLNGNQQHKIDANGNRYKLVNDVWLDTLHSGSNQSNPECCCVPDLHHQIFAQNSTNGNRHLLHNPSINDPSIKSKFISDTCTQHTTSTQSNSNNSSQQPQYAEIYGPSIHQLQHQLHQNQSQSGNSQQGGNNHYATSGLFMNESLENNDINNVNASNNMNTNPYNIMNYQTMSRQMPGILDPVNGNLKYTGYTIKMINDKQGLGLQNDANLVQGGASAIMNLNDQKKLLKYLQSTQSQTNTPRVGPKNLSNRINSEKHGNNCFTLMHQPSNNTNLHNEFMHNTNNRFNNNNINMNNIQNQHQMITYLTEQDALNNEAIRNYLEQNVQNPNSSSTPIPSLPVVPPPSLASALLAQQQHNQQLTTQQQKQLIEGYNNLLNTISRNQHQSQSPVQYNMPWNGMGNNQQHVNQRTDFCNPLPTSDSDKTAFTNARQNTSNNTSLISSLTGQSTFTAQQYASNRQQINNNQVQQDYSSISPVEDIAETELEELSYNTNQNNQNMVNNMHMNINNSNSMNGNNNHSLNSSDLSGSKQSTSRSDDDLPINMPINIQHYANHDLGNSFVNDEKKRFQPIIMKSNGDSNNNKMIDDESSDVYMTEMPQTIL